MKQLLSTLGAFALGAGTMYYFDPEMGRRRRALVRDGVVATTHDLRDYLNATGKRAGDQAYGWYASARGLMRSDQPSDEQLNARVRSRLGRLVDHPHAIQTEVRNGRVTLRGPILTHEQGALMAGIWAMRGVTGIDSQLTLHDRPHDVPALQGTPRRSRGMRMRSWAGGTLPALAVVGGIGAGLRALGGRAGGGGMVSSLAMALLAYGFRDRAWRMMRRKGAGSTRTTRRTEEATMAQTPTLGQPVPTSPAATSTWHH